mmetsp:Transcript_20952/g.53058  ORF Transcript_20952/g.53058 Transcript_20952/m.53058 type:complete len:216 (+) Transcript_20952:555-1202(+)
MKPPTLVRIADANELQNSSTDWSVSLVMPSSTPTQSKRCDLSASCAMTTKAQRSDAALACCSENWAVCSLRRYCRAATCRSFTVCTISSCRSTMSCLCACTSASSFALNARSLISRAVLRDTPNSSGPLSFCARFDPISRLNFLACSLRHCRKKVRCSTFARRISNFRWTFSSTCRAFKCRKAISCRCSRLARSMLAFCVSTRRCLSFRACSVSK